MINLEMRCKVILENRYIYILLIISFLTGALFMTIIYLRLKKYVFKRAITRFGTQQSRRKAPFDGSLRECLLK